MEVRKLRKDNAALRGHLRQAEGKFVCITITLSAVHSVIEPLIVRNFEASALFKTAARLQPFLNVNRQEVVNKAEQLRK